VRIELKQGNAWNSSMDINKENKIILNSLTLWQNRVIHEKIPQGFFSAERS
jgi:hypothetical protein